MEEQWAIGDTFTLGKGKVIYTLSGFYAGREPHIMASYDEGRKTYTVSFADRYRMRRA